MKRTHLGIVVLVVLCASIWVVATHPMFEQGQENHALLKEANHGS